MRVEGRLRFLPYGSNAPVLYSDTFLTKSVQSMQERMHHFACDSSREKCTHRELESERGSRPNLGRKRVELRNRSAHVRLHRYVDTNLLSSYIYIYAGYLCSRSI